MGSFVEYGTTACGRWPGKAAPSSCRMKERAAARGWWTGSTSLRLGGKRGSIGQRAVAVKRGAN